MAKRGLVIAGGICLGTTSPDTQISEAGRQLIARELTAVSEAQAAALFSAARFREFYGGQGADADVNAWARVLLDKVRQIVAAGPCPVISAP